MSNQLQKILQLAKKTGDRIVAFDNNQPENSFVVLSIEQYEEILGLNNGHGYNGHNTNNNQNHFAANYNSGENQRYQQPSSEKTLTEDSNVGKINNSEKMWRNDKNFQDDNVYSSGQVLKNKFKTNNWQIPNSIKEAAEKEE